MNLDNKGFGKLVIGDVDIDFVYHFAHNRFYPFVPLNGDAAVVWQKNGQSFLKQYSLGNDSVDTLHIIKQEDKSLTWTVNRMNDSFDPNFLDATYGLCLKVDKNPPILYDKVACHAVINYSDIIYPRWNSQESTSVPIVKVYSNGKPLAIACPLNSNILFYHFESAGSYYMKIATDNIASMALEIKIIQINETDYLLDVYKKHFPNAQNELDFSLVVFNKMKYHYGVRIIHDRRFSFDKLRSGANPIYKSKQASNEEVIAFSEILWEEMLLYPKNIFQLIGVSEIVLCSDLEDSSGSIIFGLAGEKTIVINISSQVSDINKRIAIHHEIYHHVDGSTESNKAELNAELFANIMIDPIFLNKCENEFKLQLQEITIALKFIDTELPSVLFNAKQRMIQPTGQFRHSQEKYKQLAEELQFRDNKLSANNAKPIEFNNSQKTLIVGYPGSGLRLMALLVGVEVIDEFIEGPPVLVARLSEKNIEKAKLCGYNVMSIVRNPFILVIKKNVIPSNFEQEFNEWKEAHEILMKHRIPFVHYEDLISINIRILAKIFESISIEFDRRITKLIDPGMSANNGKKILPGVFNLWKQNKDSLLLLYLNYQELQL